MKVDKDYCYSEGRGAKNSAGKKKAVLEVENVVCHYTEEVGNKIRSNFGCKAHRINVYEKVVQFWRKRSWYEKLPAHVSYERCGKVRTRNSW